MSAAPAAQARTAGRRHHVAILFCDVAGSTALAAMMEPEQYEELIERLREVQHQVVQRHCVRLFEKQ